MSSPWFTETYKPSKSVVAEIKIWLIIFNLWRGGGPEVLVGLWRKDLVLEGLLGKNLFLVVGLLVLFVGENIALAPSETIRGRGLKDRSANLLKIEYFPSSFIF